MKLTCWLLAVMMLTVVPVSAAKVLLDEGFEGADTPGWTHSWGTAEVTRETCAHGKQCLKTVVENAHGLSVHIYPFHAEPGTYRMSASCLMPKNQPMLGGATLAVAPAHAWNWLQEAGTDRRGEWTQLQFVFQTREPADLKLLLIPSRQQAGVGGSVIYWDDVRIEKLTKEEADKVLYAKMRSVPNPAVLEGLEVTADGQSVSVTPGRCRVGTSRVEVKQSSRFEVAPVPSITVMDEAVKLGDDAPQSWAKGTRLHQCVGRGTTLPGCVDPTSVVVKAGPGDATRYTENKDYLFDHIWGSLGRIAAGSIPHGATVYVDYRVRQMRIDSIVVAADGSVKLLPGTAAKTCPLPPDVTPDEVRIANIFMPYGATTVDPWQIYLCGPAFPAPSAAWLAEQQSRVAKTLAKLQSDQPVSIVCWGDSVTVGGDASAPEFTYANRFVATLQKRFPKSKISYHNAGIGGSSSKGRYPEFQKEVLAYKPDLVTIEFVNDMGFSPEEMKERYAKIIADVRAEGGEVVLITPHFTMPSMMGFSSIREPERRPACLVLREIAEEQKVALADASARWEHLEIEGLPYVTLLHNGINHPDDRGHLIFVDELMRLFPAKS